MSEVKDKMINIGGGAQYLQVQHRVLWLRGQMDTHPDAQLVTDIVSLDTERQYAVVRATVSIPQGGTATAHGSALASDLKPGQRAKFLEFAETRAVGRALAMLGYSTAGAQDLDEDGPDAPVDAPLQQTPQRGPQRPTTATAKPAQLAAGDPELLRKLSAISSYREQLGWSPEQVKELAVSRGLPPKPALFTIEHANELLSALDEKLGEVAVA